jgi:ABC-type transport system substrate-binding protein
MGFDPEDPAPPCVFVSGPFVPSSPYYNRAVRVRERSDKAGVREHMTAAGATMEAGRWVLRGASVDLRIGMHAGLDAEARDLLNQVGNQLQEAGFGRTVFRVSADDWNTRVLTGQFADQADLLIGKWSFGSSENVNSLFETRRGDRGAYNIFGTSSGAVDGLLARFDAARTDREAADAYHALHALLAEERPYLFLWKLDTRSAWRNEVQNNVISPYWYFTEFDGWTLRGP